MFTFQVTPDNGEPYKVTAGSRDILHWEKTTKGKSVGALSEPENFLMTDMFKLAWIAARRASLFAGRLDEFEAAHEVELVDDEDEAGDRLDPTPQAASTTT
ncbi:hypothetical protein O7626_31385 [Micromonospora sp. WMMD1102]|uniref:hypothetical protein n=1 Tax=Micromonospora sp. WMMD1102 TaxID=3016105 RepID=UPI0024152526|nr:hypothetical protein [Micromonospora sp. WMMD1102]MDG4790372.1 hypothetical protein [Micromonospora sp. WMMD1102]